MVGSLFDTFFPHTLSLLSDRGGIGVGFKAAKSNYSTEERGVDECERRREGRRLVGFGWTMASGHRLFDETRMMEWVLRVRTDGGGGKERRPAHLEFDSF
jgi:hypothetical protein